MRGSKFIRVDYHYIFEENIGRNHSVFERICNTFQNSYVLNNKHKTIRTIWSENRARAFNGTSQQPGNVIGNTRVYILTFLF